MLPHQPHPSLSFPLPHLSSVWCNCHTLPPLSACGRRPVCQQHGQSPHTPPLEQEGSPEDTPAQSRSRWDPPQRSEPQQEHPDQYLQKSCLGLCDITPFCSNLIPLLQLHPSDSLREVEMIIPHFLLLPISHQAKT